MSTQDTPDTQTSLQWSTTIEKMLADWCDEAKCFEWMHNEAYARYNKLSTGMSIGVNTSIALSGITNLIVGNIVSTNIPPSTILGCVSIVISIISMLQDKFDWLTMSNDFKQASKMWNAIARKIQEQLSIPVSGRKDCSTFLKYIKQDIDHVSEFNMTIPKDLRDKCFEKFNRIPNFNVPDICGQIEHTSVYVEMVEQPLLDHH